MGTHSGMEGISLAMFFVLHGASNEPAVFFPNIPPRMVKGKPTAEHITFSSWSIFNHKHYIEALVAKRQNMYDMIGQSSPLKGDIRNACRERIEIKYINDIFLTKQFID